MSSATELKKKLELLADAAKYDVSCASVDITSRPSASSKKLERLGICHTITPEGRSVPLLKILLTNQCIFDCAYCVNRISNDIPRASFTIQEIVQLTLQFHQRQLIEGLFLSSGVQKSADATMEQMIEVARRLREEHQFPGYIHLKTVAGASKELIEKAGLWADGLSVNIELPTNADLEKLAPGRSRQEIETTMGQIQERLQTAQAEAASSKTRFAPSGQTTQMIVGATPSTDAEILTTSESLYRQFGLNRVYYSTYQPVTLDNINLPTQGPSLLRERRLYEADWLIRFYGFSVKEILPGGQDNLRLDRDPKMNWAFTHRSFFPVDVNTAHRSALLRIPGMTVEAVERILTIREYQRLTLADLGRLNLPMKKVSYFVITADSHPSLRILDGIHFEELFLTEEQLDLFPAATIPPRSSSLPEPETAS